MARSSFFVRLSSRRQEDHAPSTNGKAKPVAQDNSWRRRSWASLSRRISISQAAKLTSPSSTPYPDCQQTALPDGDVPVPPAPYQRPLETIRQEEYPHMNNGETLLLATSARSRSPTP